MEWWEFMIQSIREFWTTIYVGYGDNPLLYKAYKVIYLCVIKR